MDFPITARFALLTDFSVEAGCSKVFREVASGAKTDRAQLRKALAQLDAGATCGW